MLSNIFSSNLQNLGRSAMWPILVCVRLHWIFASLEQNMTKRIKIDDLPDFDAAPYLAPEEAVAAYLTDIMEANDSALLAAALGDIARARGMTEIAKTAGIGRAIGGNANSFGKYKSVEDSTPAQIADAVTVFSWKK
jgi:probable addiction module antidote protein